MRLHTQNARQRCFVVPTNNALHSHHAGQRPIAVLAIYVAGFTFAFPIFQHTEVRGSVPLKASPSIGVDGEYQ
jgi:hypothetical protein